MKRTKEDAQQTREQLLRSAERLFAEKGLSSASLMEIVQDAGLSRGAAYWHFKNKEDLYVEVIRQSLDRMMHSKEQFLRPGGDPRVQLQELLALPLTMPREYTLVNGVAAQLSAYPQLAQLEELVQQRKLNLKQSVHRFLTDCVAEGRIAVPSGVETVTQMIFLLFEGLYFHNQERQDVTRDDLGKFLNAIIEFL